MCRYRFYDPILHEGWGRFFLSCLSLAVLLLGELAATLWSRYAPR